ncbi:hypothetical protein MGN01_41710 [Methylobacterium gnaphalii]|uniref:Uncharacterized protein n=2 Tax=Methylobacterium gnaphalii TaxID=1010610 RepID=A0A512JQT7_9HYPH|nr:hypothetical protein MGN01_41710 [Methylobacterium gnaphalii]GLS50891.1 hypothetical protein GCM10007885_37450 [Methylobacterium gnaphalii]
MVEVRSKALGGSIVGASPADVNIDTTDLVVLAMQEPQYAAESLRNLMFDIATRRLPMMSIMNMPPKTFLRRMVGVDADALNECFASSAVWDTFDPDMMTLCSPDPQAFRPPEDGLNVLQVTLPTNFKAAAFARPGDTALLRTLQRDIESARFGLGEESVEIPVKLKVHDSLFVPTAKWAMLLTGNYRCVLANGTRAIREAVHSDIQASQAVYTWVQKVCVTLGASPDDLVPFEKYAAAAQGLSKPSSAARALFAGAPHIERVDLLVQKIASQLGMRHGLVDETVNAVNHRLEINRAAQSSHQIKTA